MYSLFQGNQWTTRLEIGFEALFAAVAAGLLVLLIALTLIILKLGFLLLLVAGPFFLIVGIHPGFGRVIAIRWFEMLVGVLLKQVAVALTLSVLLYCYSLIMGTTDQALPWALKIMMIALVTVAVFIYRKPFQHLFSSVGYGVLGSDERAEVSWRESTFGFRRATANAAGAAVPNVGAARASRWARRGAADAPSAAEAAARRRRCRRGRRHDPRGHAGRGGRGQPRHAPGSGPRPASAPAGRRRPLPLPPHGGPPARRRRRSAGRLGARRRRGDRHGAQAVAAADAAERYRGTRVPPARTEASWPNGASRTRSGESSNGAARGRGKASRRAVLVTIAPVQVAGQAMELTTGQQRLLFVVVVLALAGLGFYLLDGRGSGGSPGAAASPSATASSTPSATGTASRRAAGHRSRGDARLDGGRRGDLPVAAVHARRSLRRREDHARRSPRTTPPGATRRTRRPTPRS